MKRLNFLLVLVITVLAGFLFYPELERAISFDPEYAEAVDLKSTMELIGGNNPLRLEMNLRQEEYLIYKSTLLQQQLVNEYRQKAEEKMEAELEMQRPPLSGKVAYLTFDDGPSEKITPKVLDVLDQYNIPATFFIIGKYARKHPDIIKEIDARGHTIGNHTYSHDYGYIYSNTDNFMREIHMTEEVLKGILGEGFHTDLVRLPGGSHAAFKKPTVKVVEDAGYRTFDWNTLNGDSEGSRMPVDYLYARFKETYRKADQVIMLMHDTDEKQTTVDALPIIIEHLILEGYEFRTLDQHN